MRIRGWLIALCVMALMVGAFYGAATLNARQAAQEQRARCWKTPSPARW